MSTAEIFKELESLARTERAGVIKRILQGLCADSKAVERIMRRVENPDVPADVWRGIEDVEDGRVVDMEAALHEKLPWRVEKPDDPARYGDLQKPVLEPWRDPCKA